MTKIVSELFENPTAANALRRSMSEIEADGLGVEIISRAFEAEDWSAATLARHFVGPRTVTAIAEAFSQRESCSTEICEVGGNLLTATERGRILHSMLQKYTRHFGLSEKQAPDFDRFETVVAVLEPIPRLCEAYLSEYLERHMIQGTVCSFESLHGVPSWIQERMRGVIFIREEAEVVWDVETSCWETLSSDPIQNGPVSVLHPHNFEHSEAWEKRIAELDYVEPFAQLSRTTQTNFERRDFLQIQVKFDGSDWPLWDHLRSERWGKESLPWRFSSGECYAEVRIGDRDLWISGRLFEDHAVGTFEVYRAVERLLDAFSSSPVSMELVLTDGY